MIYRKKSASRFESDGPLDIIRRGTEGNKDREIEVTLVLSSVKFEEPQIRVRCYIYLDNASHNVLHWEDRWSPCQYQWQLLYFHSHSSYILAIESDELRSFKVQIETYFWPTAKHQTVISVLGYAFPLATANQFSLTSFSARLKRFLSVIAKRG